MYDSRRGTSESAKVMSVSLEAGQERDIIKRTVGRTVGCGMYSMFNADRLKVEVGKTRSQATEDGVEDLDHERSLVGDSGQSVRYN